MLSQVDISGPVSVPVPVLVPLAGDGYDEKERQMYKASLAALIRILSHLFVLVLVYFFVSLSLSNSQSPTDSLVALSLF